MANAALRREAFAWIDRQSDAKAQVDASTQTSIPHEVAETKTTGVSIDSV
jgi:hypothetical protein